jgi:hypothetical protein
VKLPWKCTPASGWFCARSASGAHVFLSYSAAGVLRTETLRRNRTSVTDLVGGGSRGATPGRCDLRHIIRSRPWRSIFDVVVTGHVFSCYDDLISGAF